MKGLLLHIEKRGKKELLTDIVSAAVALTGARLPLTVAETAKTQCCAAQGLDAQTHLFRNDEALISVLPPSSYNVVRREGR